MNAQINEYHIKENNSLVGIAWYNKFDWKILFYISTENGDLKDTFQEWEKEAEERYQKLVDIGVNVHKIHIGISELMNWCEETSMPVNELARNLFLGIKFQRLYNIPED